ncbi:MAG TPA: ABC transporter ATP-binding protein [Bacteroidales bacterium]|nr:MAG: ABC transporter ATP-binding protein [Bacteroidetes bacterium GWE2_42_24]OFY31705.1 MAG: ABC transporter ATP-binding protein [Bacteroidetes bacterium GWF2_43_11]HAQ65807.1 ABC transporter ATP-binding protein [Bacteroidales bacterium]HBZ67029.1 ABC transporter ATP-binding protein [Bacteroidales bacterium]
MEPLLRADQVVKRYAGHTALDHVSISVPEGKIFGLLGPNGAGKTTLIRILNQITGPDEGFVWFGDELLGQQHIGQIGYLPEERGLYRKMKAGEQALYLAMLKGIPKEEATRRLKLWFKRFDIESWWNKKAEELSKGMQQKLQFIITVVHQPRLLIFDEPFSGFDPINANLMKDEMLRLRNEGATIVLSTHNMNSVEELCDNIALINRSKKVLDGSVNQIRQQFSKKMFEVEVEGSFSVSDEVMAEMGFELIRKADLHNRLQLVFSVSSGAGTADVLHRLADQLPVLAFKEVLPSMEEIFIEAVNHHQPL